MYFQPHVIYRDVNEDRTDAVIRYIGYRVLKNNKNFLCCVSGCLSGDTKLYGQTKTLGELYKEGKEKIETLSLGRHKNLGGYYFVKSQSTIISSGQKEIYEIELENGKKVLATAEHRFFRQNHNPHKPKDKRDFEEVEVRNLKVGDKLRDFNPELIQKYYKDVNERTQKKQIERYNPWRECIKCNNLYYVERNMKSKTRNVRRKLCRSCSKNIHLIEKKNNNLIRWAKWEDNVLRNFYYDYTPEKLMELLSLRTWDGIMWRGAKLGLKRNPHTNLGEKNGSWLGGISFEPYTPAFNNAFRELVKLRDNFCCLNCGISEQKHVVLFGIKLSVHHADYIKENTYLTNCLTLCRRCNNVANKNRNEWQEYYQEKLSKLYGYKYEEVKNDYPFNED